MRKERAGQGLLNQWRTADPCAHRKNVCPKKNTDMCKAAIYSRDKKGLFIFMKTRDTSWWYHFTVGQ